MVLVQTPMQSLMQTLVQSPAQPFHQKVMEEDEVSKVYFIKEVVKHGNERSG